MTINDSTTAAPLDAPASPPDPPSGGAAITWPRFVVKRIPGAGPEGKDAVWFPCAACGTMDVVDESLGLCRECWRPAALLTQALEQLRRELRGES